MSLTITLTETEPHYCNGCDLEIDDLDVAEGHTELCDQCRCPDCGADNNGGEGYDGYCGDCADVLEAEDHWS